jgi:hypothetical protein
VESEVAYLGPLAEALLTSTSPRIVVGALVVAVLKMMTTMRFHGERS